MNHAHISSQLSSVRIAPNNMRPNSSIDKVTPLLKWAGGKRWLASNLPNELLVSANRYIEPFVGSGAIFFALAPKSALLSDTNHELISVYRAVRDNPEKIVKHLFEHQKQHSKEYYYLERSRTYRSPEKRAAQFIYLNRVCFNGIYRVNLKGEFNVPIGTKNHVISDENEILAPSMLLKNCDLVAVDFSDTISKAEAGDLVYIDPPYTVNHNKNGFLKYNEKIFSWEDQERLSDSAFAAKRRGAKVIVSNADHESITKLYASATKIRQVSRSSVISGSSHGRGQFSELLITI